MNHSLPKYLCLFVALLQGIVLTWLYRNVEQGGWRVDSPVWLYGLATFSFAFPWMVFLAITADNIKRVLSASVTFSLVAATAGAYVGWQQMPVDQLAQDELGFVFVLTVSIAFFKALMYVQLWADRKDIRYAELFSASWINVVVFGGSLAFTGILFAILHLAGALFSVIGIDILSQVLDQAWFNIPLFAFAFCFATVILRNVFSPTIAITDVLTSLIKYLLPLLALLSIGFLIAIPFSGLEKLWATGNGTSLLLWLQLTSLLLVNVVYVEQHASPYPKLIHRCVYLAIAILPIYSILAGYGLWLRIDQYGLTIARCWALLVWFLAALFAIGYLAAIVKDRDDWLNLRNRVNIAMGLVVLGSMVAVNSPLANFQSWVVKSQFARIDMANLTYDSLDFNYLSHRLGRSGYLAIKRLEKSVEQDNPDLALKLSRLYPVYFYSRRHDGDDSQNTPLINDIVIWPEGTVIPDALITAIETYNSDNAYWERNSNSYYLIQVDLNKDNVADYVYLAENNDFTSVRVWFETSNGWKNQSGKFDDAPESDLIGTLLKTYPIETVEPTWQHLKIGDVLITVNE